MSANRDVGVELDSNFDFVIDPSGDASSVSGIEEVGKDAATYCWLVIYNLEALGTILTTNDEVIIESRIRSRLLADDRINQVVSIDIGQDFEANSITIDVDIDTIYGRTAVST